MNKIKAQFLSLKSSQTQPQDYSISILRTLIAQFFFKSSGVS